MFNSYDIVRLYNNVLKSEVSDYCVADGDIRKAIRNMKVLYKSKKSKWKQEISFVANYNDIAHRCAYLHKFAPLHTAIVQEIFSQALKDSSEVYLTILLSRIEGLKICSLGGGPGTDVIGILAAVHDLFGLHPCSAQVVELMPEWKLTCDSLFHELDCGDYGSLSVNVKSEYLNYSYISANLLSELDDIVSDAIASADLVTMVKFVSATTCKNTEAMIENIFNLMKTGSLVLFIDNASGGFEKLVSKLTTKCNLTPVFGINHMHYVNRVFNIKRYGYQMCFETTVIVQILMKQYPKLQEQRIDPDLNFSRWQNQSFSSIQDNAIRNNSLVKFSNPLLNPSARSQCENVKLSSNLSHIEGQIQKYSGKKSFSTTCESCTSETYEAKILSDQTYNNNMNVNDYFHKHETANNHIRCESSSIKDDFTEVLTDMMNNIEGIFRTMIPIFNDTVSFKNMTLI